MLGCQTLDNMFLSEKALFSTKQKTITNAPKKAATKPNYFLKVRKQTQEVTPNAPIVVVKVIVRSVHFESNAVE